MSGPEFFQTMMGRHFFDGTMPRLVKQLERLNENLEALIAAGKPEEKPSDDTGLVPCCVDGCGAPADPCIYCNKGVCGPHGRSGGICCKGDQGE